MAKKHPFAPDALEAVFRYSKGLPRKISKLCDNALIRALNQELKTVNRDIIEQVALEVRLTNEFEKLRPAKQISKKKKKEEK